MGCKVSQRAAQDLAAIYFHGATTFGEAQAERYQRDLFATLDLLAASPRMARERTEFRRPIRLYPRGSHVIAYVEQGEDILIVRVLHGRQDWKRFL